jgi:hypothetical protein
MSLFKKESFWQFGMQATTNMVEKEEQTAKYGIFVHRPQRSQRF